MFNSMDSIRLNIEPVTKQITHLITSFEVSIRNIQLNTSAMIEVRLFNDKNELFKIEILNLEGDDYKLWSNDDSFIYSYVANKLNLTLQN